MTHAELTAAVQASLALSPVRADRQFESRRRPVSAGPVLVTRPEGGRVR